jgi:hypothetical protein
VTLTNSQSQQTASLWRHRNFLLLWSGQTVSEMGSAVTSLALPLTAVVVLKASTLQVGLLTTASYAAFAPEHLMDGNGKLGASESFAQICGPGLGGGLVGAFGAAGAMTADAISYGVSVASLLAIRLPEPPPPQREDRNLRAEIAEGLNFVVRNPILRKIAACTATANLFVGMMFPLEILFLVRVLKVHPADPPAAVLPAGRVHRDPALQLDHRTAARVAARPVPLASIRPGAVRLDFACLAARPQAGCGDFAPHGRFRHHGHSLSSCVVAGERADDGGFSWLPR